MAEMDLAAFVFTIFTHFNNVEFYKTVDNIFACFAPAVQYPALVNIS